MDTNQKRTKTTVADEPCEEIHTRSASQAHIGKNHRMFSGAVTLPIQSLRKYARKSTVAATGLTRIRPKIWVFPEKYPFFGSNPG